MSGCDCTTSNCVTPQIPCPIQPLQNFPYNTPYTAGEEIALRNNWIASQTNTDLNPAPFTTNPNWPYNTGSDVSQLQTNTQAKTIFNNINERKQAGTLFGTGCPIFKTQQEKILYIQAQYAQPVGFPGDNNRLKLGINTLFS